MLAAPSAGRPEFESSGIRNSFGGAAGPVAPGELVSIFGSGLGPIPGKSFGFDAEGRLPTSGPGVTVLVNGTPAPLLFVSATQINLQVPYEAGGSREAEFVVIVNGVSSSPARVPVQTASPGLWPILYNEDASINSPANGARPGSVIVAYATGLSASALAATRLSLGGRPAEILFIGEAPGTVGVFQINARIPVELPDQDAHSVVLAAGVVQSQAGVSVAVRERSGG
jgi:uncharacterized protein (TIGR03437 family)